MKKQKKEISSFKMLNQLMDEGKIKNPYRFFHVYHPVYEVTVNIDVERTVDEYHIIEKYMDKLVCGYTGDKGTVTDKVYIKDRKQLYGLLGLEHQAYEVAERFFEDLLMAGHFVETKEGIRATKTAHNSIKLQKKCISSTEKQKKLFDAFTMKLLPVDFYEMMHLAVDKDNINENDEHAKHAVWLNPSYISERNSVEVERMIKRHTYTNQEIIDKGLPQGYKKMQVDAEGDIALKFFPYYLVILGSMPGPQPCRYRRYRLDKPQMLTGIDYSADEYSDVRVMLRRLSEREERCEVQNPLCREFIVCNEDKACHEEGFYFDYEFSSHYIYKNFHWKVQDKQIKYLLGLDENSSFQKTVCKMIAEGKAVALTSYNAGRLLYIEKTEEQKQLLLEAVRNPECDRKKLFEKYLGFEVLDITEKKEEKPEILTNAERFWCHLKRYLYNWAINSEKNCVSSKSIEVYFKQNEHADVWWKKFITFSKEDLKAVQKICEQANQINDDVQFLIDDVRKQVDAMTSLKFSKKDFCGECVDRVNEMIETVREATVLFRVLWTSKKEEWERSSIPSKVVGSDSDYYGRTKSLEMNEIMKKDRESLSKEDIQAYSKQLSFYDWKLIDILGKTYKEETIIELLKTELKIADTRTIKDILDLALMKGYVYQWYEEGVLQERRMVCILNPRGHMLFSGKNMYQCGDYSSKLDKGIPLYWREFCDELTKILKEVNYCATCKITKETTFMDLFDVHCKTQDGQEKYLCYCARVQAIPTTIYYTQWERHISTTKSLDIIVPDESVFEGVRIRAISFLMSEKRNDIKIRINIVTDLHGKDLNDDKAWTVLRRSDLVVQEKIEQEEKIARARKLHSDGNYEEAFALYLELSDKVGEAAYKVGLYYEEGKCVEQDVGKALHWFEKAIDMGDYNARRSYLELEKKL